MICGNYFLLHDLFLDGRYMKKRAEIEVKIGWFSMLDAVFLHL